MKILKRYYISHISLEEDEIELQHKYLKNRWGLIHLDANIIQFYKNSTTYDKEYGYLTEPIVYKEIHFKELGWL